MARPGITREQVFDTAESLLLEGQTPTVMGVRTRLGGGSPNTITPWLAEWKAEHETKKVDVLPTLPESVEAAMRQVWGAAWKAAQVQLEAEREALSSIRKDIERERAEMLGEIQRLDSALDQAQGETRQVVETLDAERRAYEQTRAEVREARVIAAEREKSIQDKSEELRDARRQLGEATAQSSRLETELAHTRNDLKDAQIKVVKLREAAAGLSTERGTVKSDNERLTREYERAQETAKQAKAALDAGAQKIGKLEVALEDEREARKIAEKALADLRVEWATLTERAVQVEKLQAFMALRHPDSANPAG